MSRCRSCSRDLSLLPHTDTCRYAKDVPAERRVVPVNVRARLRASKEHEDYRPLDLGAGASGSARMAYAYARLAADDERRSAELDQDERVWRPDPDEVTP